jgi:hypothetical protein
MSKPSSSRVARVLKGLARWSVIGILSLVVLELLCHVVQLSGDSMTVDYVADPWLPYRMKPGSGGTSAFGVLYEINAVGLRSPEVVMPKPPGVFLLEKMVEGSRVEVINAGASGYHFDDFVAYLEHYGLALDPDMVLCAFTRSDVEPPIKLDVRGGVGYEPGENVGFVPPFVKKLLRHSRLYLAVGRARWALGYQRAEENEADRNAAIVQKWPVVQATLDKLVSLTKERHLPLMVAYLPVQIEVFRGAEYPLLIDRLAKLDAPDYHFMNVLPDFEAQKDKVLYLRLDPAHPNAPGHQIIARAIAADPFFSARIKTGSK